MRTPKLLTVLFVVISVFTWSPSLGVVNAQTDELLDVNLDIPETEYIKGRIIQILEEENIETNGVNQPYQKLEVLVTDGSIAGDTLIVENGNFAATQAILYQKGDKVILSYIQTSSGAFVNIIDFVRTDGLLLLLGIFVMLALFVAQKKGFFSLMAMVASFVIIFTFVLPRIQAGDDPIFVAIVASLLIIPITFYLSHGFEKKTTVAMMGTLIALVFTGILASIFVGVTRLSGTATEESMFLQSSSQIIYDLRGLLLAGIIIGTLGVMDDITVSQAAIVYQLHDLKKDLHFNELFTRSIAIGKDHIASMINTLILVYTGAAMPLLVLFMNNPRPMDELLSFELIATEIVRTLVGSIGLILAVPITTYLACFYVKREK